jgi:hypothetical protein
MENISSMKSAIPINSNSFRCRGELFNIQITFLLKKTTWKKIKWLTLMFLTPSLIQHTILKDATLNVTNG